MTTLDVRDVLNLPQNGGSGGSSSSRASKKQKITASASSAFASRANLKGLAREVQSLGGDNPIAIVPQMLPHFKKRRIASRKLAARWELRPFKNSAREDESLILCHWRRKPTSTRTDAQEDQPQEGADTVDSAASGTHRAEEVDGPLEDSAFAKFNVKISLPQYNGDQYESNLQNADWTREETDYLMELVRDFDLRWPLIWDRYEYRAEGEIKTASDGAGSTALVPASQSDGSSRTMEDLKARYYEIAAKMMAVQKPAQYMTQAEYNLHGMMANFKPQQEKARKAFVGNAMTRTREEVREEEALLLEVRRIMARVDRTNEERHELYNRLDFPHTDQDISSFKTSNGLQQLLQTLMVNNDKSKKRKSLAAGEGVSPIAGAANTVAGGSATEAGGRRESIAASGMGGHNRRESVTTNAEKAEPAAAGVPVVTPIAPVGKNSKKGAAQIERRKLTEQEQDVYGVSYHERLGSGPTFRYEKINKLFTHKSGQQQLRISNILNELEMPQRLFMPTASVTAQFEQLVSSVVQLVDLRKVSDKLDGEIKVEENRKAERDKARALILASQNDEAADDGSKENKKTAAPGDAKLVSAVASSEKGEATAKGEKEETAPDDKDNAAVGAPGSVNSEVTRNEGDNAKAKPYVSDAANQDDVVKDEPQPDNSGNSTLNAGTAHKRSASVLSASSDKSSKRQKK